MAANHTAKRGAGVPHVESRFWSGLTYDDVLLVPQRSGARSRKDVTTQTQLSRNVSLAIPIVASNMDTVCEAPMAVEMAREGGIGILHRFCSVEEQCEMVRRVKRAQSSHIDDPRWIEASATKADALEGFKWPGRKGGVNLLMVVEWVGGAAPHGRKKLLGVIAKSDLLLAGDDAKVSALMTPLSKLVVSHNANLGISEAKEIMFKNRCSNIPIVDADGTLIALVTASDIYKLQSNRNATVDKNGRLVVGAAIGVKKGDLERARALCAAGADVLVIDIAHGHSDICIDMLRSLKNDPTITVDIIAGNIATGAAALDLIEAGADGLKVGVGPGSICITRLVAGAGVPQLSALLDVCRVANPRGVPVIADGGVKTAGDISKACAAGSSTVMLGNMLAGTDEAPGRVLVKDGKKVKIIRGMAGYGANISKAERENNVDEDLFLDMVPEGVEGNVPYKGPVGPILRQLVGGLRSGISYCGATNLAEMRQRAQFVRMTAAGARESGPHDISKL